MTQDTTTDDEPDEQRRDLWEAWINCLGEIWMQVDWNEFDRPQTSRATVFGDRVDLAKSESDVHAALSTIAREFGMNVPDLPTEPLRTLVDEPKRAMVTLRREDVYLVNEADQAVRDYFDSLNDEDSGTEPKTSTLDEFIEVN